MQGRARQGALGQAAAGRQMLRSYAYGGDMWCGIRGECDRRERSARRPQAAGCCGIGASGGER